MFNAICYYKGDVRFLRITFWVKSALIKFEGTPLMCLQSKAPSFCTTECKNWRFYRTIKSFGITHDIDKSKFIKSAFKKNYWISANCRHGTNLQSLKEAVSCLAEQNKGFKNLLFGWSEDSGPLVYADENLNFKDFINKISSAFWYFISSKKI